MNTIIEMSTDEIQAIAGGLTVAELEKRFPDGVWIGSSFFPNGLPEMPSITGTEPW